MATIQGQQGVAVAIIKKDYLTFAELRDSFGITDEEMHYLIATGELVPAVFWEAKFLFEHQLFFSSAHWEPVIDSSDDRLALLKDEFGSVTKLAYLRRPIQTGVHTFRFNIASVGVSTEELEFVFGDWFLLHTSAGVSNGIGLVPLTVATYIDETASDEFVFTADAIAAYEQNHPGQSVRSGLAPNPTSSNDQSTHSAQSNNKWPWGNHETDLLRKLSEAAIKFWKNYDPEDASTAPTNQQVIDWLKSQRVSERVAQTMATILRADGLPTGPR